MKSPNIQVTEDEVVVTFSEDVSEDVAVVVLVLEDGEKPLPDLGYEPQHGPEDKRTLRWKAPPGFRPAPGTGVKVRPSKPGAKKFAPVVTQYRPPAAGDDDEEPAHEDESYEAPPSVVTSADDVRAFPTACGAVVALPGPIADDQLVVTLQSALAAGAPEEHGWRLRRPDERSVEVVAVGPEAQRAVELRLALEFPGADGVRRETVAVPLALGAPGRRGPAMAGPLGPAASSSGGNGGTARGRRTGGGGDGGGGGRFGANPPGGGNGGTKPTGFDARGLFSVPLRVATGGTGGASSPDEGYRAWVDRIVALELPRMAHDPDAVQFRDSLAELAAVGTTPAPSPYLAPVAIPAAFGAAIASNGGLTTAQLAGPFATLLTEAEALEKVAQTAVKDIRPIIDTADLDIVATRRAMLADAIARFIREARRPLPDGPEIAVVATQLAVIEALLPLFGEALGVTDPVNAVSQEDFANVSRYEVIQVRVDAVGAIVRDRLPGDEGDPRVGVADLEQLLGVVDENARDLQIELENATIGPMEQATKLVAAPDAYGPPITLARLLTWLQEESGQNLKTLLDQAGREAAPVVAGVLDDQLDYVGSLAAFIELDEFPWSHPIVARAVTVLGASLEAARDQARVLDPHRS